MRTAGGAAGSGRVEDERLKPVGGIEGPGGVGLQCLSTAPERHPQQGAQA